MYKDKSTQQQFGHVINKLAKAKFGFKQVAKVELFIPKSCPPASFVRTGSYGMNERTSKNWPGYTKQHCTRENVCFVKEGGIHVSQADKSFLTSAS